MKIIKTRINKDFYLGDKVEEVLAPIVEVLDKNLGTNFKGCAACQRRKQWLNNLTKQEESFGKQDNT